MTFVRWTYPLTSSGTCGVTSCFIKIPASEFNGFIIIPKLYSKGLYFGGTLMKAEKGFLKTEVQNDSDQFLLSSSIITVGLSDKFSVYPMQTKKILNFVILKICVLMIMGLFSLILWIAIKEKYWKFMQKIHGYTTWREEVWLYNKQSIPNKRHCYYYDSAYENTANLPNKTTGSSANNHPDNTSRKLQQYST